VSLRCASCHSDKVVKIRTTTNLANPVPIVWIRCEECGEVWSVPRERWEEADDLDDGPHPVEPEGDR
jgi:uncharacterized Zn finger protein